MLARPVATHEENLPCGNSSEFPDVRVGRCLWGALAGRGGGGVRHHRVEPRVAWHPKWVAMTAMKNSSMVKMVSTSAPAYILGTKTHSQGQPRIRTEGERGPRAARITCPRSHSQLMAELEPVPCCVTRTSLELKIASPRPANPPQLTPTPPQLRPPLT